MADPIYDDGGLQTGCRILTIGPEPKGVGGDDYEAENFNVNRPSKTIVQYDHEDIPAKQKTYRDVKTGTATLQLDGADARPPKEGWEFSVTGCVAKDDADADVEEVFYISEVGTAETQNGEKKIPITFRERLNDSAEDGGTPA